MALLLGCFYMVLDDHLFCQGLSSCFASGVVTTMSETAFHFRMPLAGVSRFAATPTPDSLPWEIYQPLVQTFNLLGAQFFTGKNGPSRVGA
jgi:hypothetical protein